MLILAKKNRLFVFDKYLDYFKIIGSAYCLFFNNTGSKRRAWGENFLEEGYKSYQLPHEIIVCRI